MDEKRWFLILVVVVLAFFALPEVRANFVCGGVASAEVNPAWFSVDVWYTERPESYTTCLVSPAEGKYCCDPEEIEDVSWGIGKEVNARIVQGDYVADEVSLSISGEGYDVFPQLVLVKALEVHEPSEPVYFGASEIFVNVSTSSDFNQLAYVLDYNGAMVESEICVNCTSAEFYLVDLERGQYELTVIARGDQKSDIIFESKRFALLDYLEFSRNITCEKCKGNMVSSGENVTVTISMQASHEISGIFRDYFPTDWGVLSGEAIEEFSETHNAVRWNVTGLEFVRNYTLQAPRVFIPRQYLFVSGFDSYLSEVSEVVLRGLWRFFPLSRNLESNISAWDFFIGYERVLPDAPLVVQVGEEGISEVAIFPKGEMHDIYGFVHESVGSGLFGDDNEFIIGSNIADEEIEGILVRVSAKKRGEEIVGVDLYRYDKTSESWIRDEMVLYDEDENFEYYEVYVDNKGAFTFEIIYE